MDYLVCKINGVADKAEYALTSTLKHEATTWQPIHLLEEQRMGHKTQASESASTLGSLMLAHFLSCSNHCTPALKCTPATSVVARSGNWTNIFGNPR